MINVFPRILGPSLKDGDVIYGKAPYFLLNIPQGEDHKVRTKRFSNIFNLVDMPGLPPDLEAIFGKIRQKKHFRQGFIDLIKTKVTIVSPIVR